MDWSRRAGPPHIVDAAARHRGNPAPHGFYFREFRHEGVGRAGNTSTAQRRCRRAVGSSSDGRT